MSLPLVTAVAPRWEVELAAALARSGQVHVARRCADVAELLGVAAAGVVRVAVVSSDLRGLDRAVLDQLGEHGVDVLGVHPPQDEAAARTLRRWGVHVVLPADSGTGELDEGIDQLLADSPEDAHRAEHLSSGRHGGVGESARPAPEGSQLPEEATSAPYLSGPDPGEEEGGGLPGVDDELESTGEEHARGRVLVVWGPAGSPGRTTVAVNLAAELADPLSPVVLVDADTYASSVGQVLGVLDEVPGVAAAARAADQGVLDREALAQLAPEVRPGLRVLTGLPRADRWPELRDVALADVLECCRQLGDWTVVDVAPYLEQDEELSFDTLAPRRNGATLTALDAADAVVVVGAGDPVGLQRLVRGLDLLGGHTVAERTVVVTRVRPGPVGREPGRRIAEALERFAGVGEVHLVPEDQESLDAALLHGSALEEVRPRSPARMAIADLADLVSGRSRHRRASGVPPRGTVRPGWGGGRTGRSRPA